MENPQGDWTFRIRDAYETDAGMLNSAINIWKITLVEPNFELTNFVLYPNPNKGNFSSVY
jgi:subtilisin-like proprotein convertase family protein